MSSLGFKARMEFLTCMFCHLCIIDSSDSPLVWHLLTLGSHHGSRIISTHILVYEHCWGASPESNIPVPHSYVQALVKLEPRIKHSTSSQLCTSIGDARVWDWAFHCLTVMYKHWWRSSLGLSIPLPHSYVQALVMLEPRIKHSTTSQLCTSIGDARVWDWAFHCLTVMYKHWWHSSLGLSIPLPHSYVQALVMLEPRIKHSTASQLCSSIDNARV